MPNFVDPKILLWNPDLLWARYLQVLAEWKADTDSEKINLPVYSSPKDLGRAMQSIAKYTDDYEGFKLRWEILLAFGYQASKHWLKWADVQSEKITDDICGLLATDSQEAGDGTGMDFSGSIPPD